MQVHFLCGRATQSLDKAHLEHILNFMRTTEPQPADMVQFLREAFGFHGPRRYGRSMEVKKINGAVTCVAPPEGWCNKSTGSLAGNGALFAWFVGSPRVFRFGFARSKGWATRRMTNALLEERQLAQEAN